MLASEIQALIERSIPGCRAIVEGEDEIHFSATVIGDVFSGKSMVEQHRLVYLALGELVGKEIHALALRTMTPENWANEERADERNG